MKKPINYLILLLCLGLFACDDILEEDITDDIIQLISPTNGQAIEGNTVNFSWQVLDGADDYRIQILNANQSYVLDSLVSTNSFVFNLNPGAYQWRVKGENFAYETQFTFPVNFSVEASDDLTNQTVILQTPSNNLYTNDTDIIITWSSLTTAEHYNVAVVKSLNGQETVFEEANVLSTTFNLPTEVFDVDAEYIWKVKAVNSTSESPYSQRSIFIDRNAPNQPTLVSPTNQQTTTSNVTFNWTNGTDTGNVPSPITNTIEISTDTNFNTITHSATTSNNSYAYEFENTGTYYWRVKSEDSAGNMSDYSTITSLIVE